MIDRFGMFVKKNFYTDKNFLCKYVLTKPFECRTMLLIVTVKDYYIWSLRAVPGRDRETSAVSMR